MEKRIVKRQAGKILAAAVAAAGLAGLASSSANASLLVDLRASAVTGTGASKSADGKTVTAVAGSVVTMDLYAKITGSNHTQILTDVNGDGSQFSTQNDDTLQILVGSLKSNAGGLLGDITKPTTIAALNPAVWNGAGSQPGTQIDVDSDTDLDLGQYTSTDSASMWIGRSANPTAIIANGDGTNSYTGGVPSPAGKGGVINDQTSELYLGSFRFTLASGASGTTGVNFVLRPQSSGTSALWFEDGSAAGKDPFAPGAFSLGTPVTINGPASVPEPASIGLLGLASVGLLARRRDKKA